MVLGHFQTSQRLWQLPVPTNNTFTDNSILPLVFSRTFSLQRRVATQHGGMRQRSFQTSQAAPVLVSTAKAPFAWRYVFGYTTGGPTVEEKSSKYGLGCTAVVVGAGPAGLLTALLLAQRGFNVEILEKRPAPDAEEIKHGSRSIVFGLLERGQVGLREAGIRLPERGSGAVWLNGLALSKGAYSNRYADGKVTSRFSALPPSVLFVERAALVEHMILEMQRLEPDRIKLNYGALLSDIDFQQKQVSVTCSSGQQSVVPFDILVGSDGRNSGVRAALERLDPDLQHTEVVSSRSYRGFHKLPPIEGVDLGDEDGATITFNTYGTKVTFSSTFWPTRYGTVTGHVSCPREWFEENPNVPDSYEALFREKFPQFPEAWRSEAAKQLVEATESPNGASVKCSKLHGPHTVILGDCAHGVTPALGQGCNAALQSAHIFAQVLDECSGDMKKAAPRFTEARLADAHALYALDRSARQITGADGVNLTFLGARFHMLLGKALKQCFPFWHSGPAYGNLMASTMRYSTVHKALQRDRNLLVCLFLAAVAGIAILLKHLVRAATPLMRQAMA